MSNRFWAPGVPGERNDNLGGYMVPVPLCPCVPVPLYPYVSVPHACSLYAPSSSSFSSPRVIPASLSPPGFQKASIIAYKNEGDSVEFSFPLNLAEENAQGELRWKAEEASFFQHWVTFFVKNKEVSVKKTTDNPKLQMAEILPISLKIVQVSLQCAGTGNLTLILDQGILYQEVNLVVMKGEEWAKRGQAG